jgi:hypothetical protein
VQTEAYAPIHVRKGEGSRGLRLAVDNDAIEASPPSCRAKSTQVER